MKFMSRFEPQAYALLRIVTGFLFIWHGALKFANLAEATRPWHIQWVAGPIELIGGALVMVGLVTRPAAFLCSGMAAAAYWVGHFPRAPWPIQNGGEAAVLFAFIFLYLAARGTGIWGLGKR
ncbi:MAG: DoxX family protein [Xanthomonadales bacterium]|nr:DoxX family protein [Xanthomonadales bacterium]